MEPSNYGKLPKIRHFFLTKSIIYWIAIHLAELRLLNLNIQIILIFTPLGIKMIIKLIYGQ